MQGPIDLLLALQYILMSIIIKSDEVNVLIYKYLQQCNLAHSAYTLFNQANLEQSLVQYKFDVKSGQLVSLMEKALIFSQIQSHITINDYEECKQCFYLLKPHVCKITQRAKQQKQNLLEELNQKIFTTMRRTSSVHNTLQPNREFQQIIYEQRSANFFDKIPLKIDEASQITIKLSPGETMDEKYLCALDSETQTITKIIKKDNFFQAAGIVPCKGKIETFQIRDNLLIQIYKDSLCSIIQIQNNGTANEILSFKLSLLTECKNIKANKKIKNLISFESQQQFCIVNINSKKVLAHKEGKMQWVGYFQYLVLDDKNKNITKYSLKPDAIDSPKTFSCSLVNARQLLNFPTQIKISLSEIYFSVQSLSQNKVLVYNFDQSQPLYIFDMKQTTFNESIDFGDQAQTSEKLKQVLWVTANSTDSLILVTDLSIKSFEIELNNFSKVIQIGCYDADIKKVGRVKKNEENMFLVGLGAQNMIFYDIGLGKIERVQYAQDNHPAQIFELSDFSLLAIQLQNRLLFLQTSDIQPLFL